MACAETSEQAKLPRDETEVAVIEISLRNEPILREMKGKGRLS